MTDRERLTFHRPVEPSAPASVVVMTTVQLVDASGVQVRAGTGRAVTQYDDWMADVDVDAYAQTICDKGLEIPVQVPAAEADEEAPAPVTLTRDGLKALLDEKGIEYQAKATKDELLALLPPSPR